MVLGFGSWPMDLLTWGGWVGMIIDHLKSGILGTCKGFPKEQHDLGGVLATLLGKPGMKRDIWTFLVGVPKVSLDVQPTR